MTVPQSTNGEVSGHRFATLAVHAGAPIDPSTGAVIDAVSHRYSITKWRLTDVLL